MRITIFGTGYVGLVTGTCFAEMGNDVICIDIDPDKIKQLNDGQVPIYEPGLEDMVRVNKSRGHLRFTTDSEAGVEHGDVIFIAVGTPPGEDGSADLQYVLEVARTIGTHMQTHKVIVDKSTVPVGTGDSVRQRITDTLAERVVDLSFSVVSNPEFLKEGAAISDFMKPDRVVIGSEDVHGRQVMEQLYAPFNRNHDKVVHMDIRSAELTKYAANVMLATKISLMNEMANMADQLGADIEAVRRGIGMDPRIGYHFIYPGTGYGGSCFPKDVKALIYTADQIGYSADIISSVEQVNNRQKRVLFDKLMGHFEGSISGRKFAMWGLAFKPNTDDMREAPSITLIDLLTEQGARVVAYDPEANTEARHLFSGNNLVEIVDDKEATLDDADGLLIVTEWNEFRSPNFNLLSERMQQTVLFDGRNLFDPAYLKQQGFIHYGIGRGSDTL